MSPRAVRLLVAIAVPIAAFAIAHWYDWTVLQDAQISSASRFEVAGVMNQLAMTHLVGAACAVAVFVVVLWARSLAVSVLYTAIGAAIVFLPVLCAAFAVGINGAAPPAPEPIARFLGDQMSTGLAAGPSRIVLTIGGVMFIGGIAGLVARAWPRLAASVRTAPEAGSQVA